MKIDTEKLERLIEHTIRCCECCRSSDCGYSCQNKAILEACGKHVPKHPKGDDR